MNIEEIKNTKMEINDLLKISKFQISKFLNFADIEQVFSPNINLIIGKNNTGKTSFIKFLYTTIKAFEEFEKQKYTYKDSCKKLLNTKIREVFQSKKGSGTIVKNTSENNLLTKITFKHKKQDETLKFSIRKGDREISKFEFSDRFSLEMKKKEFSVFNAIFVPAKELFSTFRTVGKAFKDREFGFDATYNDTINSIISPFKHRRLNQDFLNINLAIEEKILEGKIEQSELENEFFYINKQGEKFEMTMTAEGIKQLGIIPTLINTGELRKGTILFLDEPDNNLNPVAIREFINVLVMLSKAGVQIFLTTHNYFVMNRLHLSARRNKDLAIKYFSLYENEEDLIEIESGFLNNNLPSNDIIDEAIDIANEDMNLDIAEL